MEQKDIWKSTMRSLVGDDDVPIHMDFYTIGTLLTWAVQLEPTL